SSRGPRSEVLLFLFHESRLHLGVFGGGIVSAPVQPLSCLAALVAHHPRAEELVWRPIAAGATELQPLLRAAEPRRHLRLGEHFVVVAITGGRDDRLPRPFEVWRRGGVSGSCSAPLARLGLGLGFHHTLPKGGGAFGAALSVPPPESRGGMPLARTCRAVTMVKVCRPGVFPVIPPVR